MAAQRLRRRGSGLPVVPHAGGRDKAKVEAGKKTDPGWGSSRIRLALSHLQQNDRIMAVVSGDQGVQAACAADESLHSLRKPREVHARTKPHGSLPLVGSVSVSASSLASTQGRILLLRSRVVIRDLPGLCGIRGMPTRAGAPAFAGHRRGIRLTRACASFND